MYDVENKAKKYVCGNSQSARSQELQWNYLVSGFKMGKVQRDKNVRRLETWLQMRLVELLVHNRQLMLLSPNAFFPVFVSRQSLDQNLMIIHKKNH